VRRKIRAVAALAVVAVIGVGCGGTGSSGGTTTAAPAGNAGDSTDTPRDNALRFAECMRDNGVSEFPDPGAQGAFTIEVIANGSSVDTSSAAFKRAETACKDLEPAGFYGRTRSPKQQQAALEFAQCIRDHGVKDFPDPAIDDPLVDTYRIPSSNTEAGLAILNAAMQKCGRYASAAGVKGP
jgi:hypothetical protein